jgi:type I restriction enzyme S subunit
MNTTKLKNVCVVVSGSTPKSTDKRYWNGTHVWITPAELSEDSFIVTDSERHITDEAIKATGLKSFPKGTVLLSSRAPIGKVAIAGCEMYCNQGFKNLICSESIYNLYLYYFLKSKTAYLNSLGRGATFKEISKGIVEDISIPFPVYSEQIRIAKQLQKISELISLKKGQYRYFDDIIRSRFLEMFGDIELNSQNMQKMMWQEVFDTQTGKLDANAAVKGGRYPFFTCAKEISTIDEYAYDCEALLLAGNNAVGDYDVKYYKGKFNAYQRTYILMLKNRQYSYSVFKFQLEQKLRYLQLQSKGTNTRYLTMGILRSLDFIVPPIVKQQEFAQFVNATDKSKMAVQKSLDELEILKKSLMQTYFG